MGDWDRKELNGLPNGPTQRTYYVIGRLSSFMMPSGDYDTDIRFAKLFDNVQDLLGWLAFNGECICATSNMKIVKVVQSSLVTTVEVA